ncbi:unnamed protein product, partial [Nesidiocoris tenuis]
MRFIKIVPAVWKINPRTRKFLRFLQSSSDGNFLRDRKCRKSYEKHEFVVPSLRYSTNLE